MSERIPIFPLGVVLVPRMLLPIHVFEERYRRMMRDRQGEEHLFGVVLAKPGREVGEQPEMHRVGTVATLVGSGRYPDGRYDLIVRGRRRFRIGEGDWERGYHVASVDWLDEPVGPAPDGQSVSELAESTSRAYGRYLDALQAAVGTPVERDGLPGDAVDLGYALLARLPLGSREKQALLEAPTAVQRLLSLNATLRRERVLLERTGIGGVGVEHPGANLSSN